MIRVGRKLSPLKHCSDFLLRRGHSFSGFLQLFPVVFLHSLIRMRHLCQYFFYILYKGSADLVGYAFSLPHQLRNGTQLVLRLPIQRLYLSAADCGQ